MLMSWHVGSPNLQWNLLIRVATQNVQAGNHEEISCCRQVTQVDVSHRAPQSTKELPMTPRRQMMDI